MQFYINILLLNSFIEMSKANSNFKWMKTVMSKGTVSDRIAANTVTIQDNPVCNLETIRNLVGMVKIGKKKECIAVVGKNSKFRFFKYFILLK